MTPGIRQLALTAHVTSSVGWLGTVASFQALAIAALTSRDPVTVRGFYLGTDAGVRVQAALCHLYVVVPGTWTQVKPGKAG